MKKKITKLNSQQTQGKIVKLEINQLTKRNKENPANLGKPTNPRCLDHMNRIIKEKEK